MHGILHDLRFGVRKLAKTPGTTLVIVTTLALGIGANAAIFSVVHGVLLRPLPYTDGDELLRLRQQAPLAGVDDQPFSVAEIRDYREQSTTLEAVVEYHSMSFTLLGGEEPHRVQTGVVSAGFFDVLGLRPLHGRTFLPGEDAPTADAVMVLSYELWHTLTGGDPGVVGRTYEMNDKVHTVVGVLPPVPAYPGHDDVFVPTSACPFRSSEAMIANRDMRMLRALARRRSDASPARVRADLDTIAARLAASYPESYPERSGYRTAAVPVLDMVAAILRAMMPDLPMPVTMTRPLQACSRSSAAGNVGPSCGIRPRMAWASVSSTRRAMSIDPPLLAGSCIIGPCRLLRHAGCLGPA